MRILVASGIYFSGFKSCINARAQVWDYGAEAGVAAASAARRDQELLCHD